MSEWRPPQPPPQKSRWPLWLFGLTLFVVLGGLAFGSCIYIVSHSDFGEFDAGKKRELPPPPPPDQYGSGNEIGTRGDTGNPGVYFNGAYPSDAETQERLVGGAPARFSGYTTWIRSVRRVPARSLVDGYAGDFLKVRVTVFNRDKQEQHVCACDFSVWSVTHGQREADVVPAKSVAPYTTMASGETLNGDVYLYVGKAKGPLFIVYHPDDHVLFATSESTGVWRAA